MEIAPVTLDGRYVRLEPLGAEHIKPLAEFCFDERIWRWFPFEIWDERELESYILDARRQLKERVQVPFATIEKSSDTIIGSTRFMNIDERNRGVEIGSTRINPEWQGTYANTEAKLLMLTHAFEEWKCLRVEFKTDALNRRLRSAILRLGAKEEGIHRQHMITDAGRLRDSVFYNILDSEWNRIEDRLRRKLA